jgi:hypothetical protein
MSTRSRIGIELQNGSIVSAYHHSDGYPEWLGKTLTEHYTTKEKVTELIDGGDMSSCWTKERWNDQLQKNYGSNYYSYRGEDCPPRLDADLCEYLLPAGSEEYAYLFTNGEWVCYHMHQFDDTKLPEIVKIPSLVTA